MATTKKAEGAETTTDEETTPDGTTPDEETTPLEETTLLEETTPDGAPVEVDDDARQAAQPCGHPNANGNCWFAQIADPCGYACKWLIDQGEDAGR